MRTQAPPRRKTAKKAAPRKAIDPRIRDRRVAVLRAQGRRRLRWVVGLIVLGILAAAAWFVIHSPLLDVERIRVTGTQQATPAEARFAAGVNLEDPILFVDTGAVAERVERVAWVDRARVERDLGGTIAVHVTERLPAAWVRRAPDQVALVDARGRALVDVPEPPADLPELVGLASVPAVGQEIAPAAVAGMLEKLPSELRGRTTHVVIEADGITFGLRDGPEVRLGTPRRLAVKARAALAVLASTAAAPPRYIDVRVPAAPVAG